MDVYFVMDIRNGKVVAGKMGKRDEYMEISKTSKIVSTSNPVNIVNILRPKNVYIADLDRIERKGDNFQTILEISGKVERTIADLGFEKIEEKPYPFTPVLGTETFDLRLLKDGDWIVSIDVKEKLLDRSRRFESMEEVIEYLNSYRISGIIVLPIHRVGSLTFDLSLVETAVKISDHPVLTGGGLKSREDLFMAKEIGLDGVLVSTAFHLGLLGLHVLREGKI